MPTTSRGYPYPAFTDAPNGPVQLQALAAALNTDVGAQAGAVAALQARAVVLGVGTIGSETTHVATDFAGSGTSATVTVTVPSGRWIYVTAIVPAFGIQGSGVPFGHYQLARGNTAIGPQMYAVTGSGDIDFRHSQPSAQAYLSAPAAGSTTFGLRFWCGATASQVVLNAGAYVAVLDLGPAT